MKIEQVACQLFTLRDHLKTSEDIRSTLKKVAGIGYRAVQVSGMGPIAEEELVKIIDDEGLTLCATHEPARTIVEKPEAVVERLRKLGCKYTAYPHPAGVDFTKVEDVAKLARDLDRAGKVLHEAGQVLTYHNHSNEFLKIGGKTILRYLYDETDPSHLQGEIDTYWVQAGGGDPVAWCESLRGRLPLLHMKDYMITPQIQPAFAEIGNGNLDWKRIIAAAESSGCEWFVVEQDTTPGDPFESIRKSFDYIQANLI